VSNHIWLYNAAMNPEKAPIEAINTPENEPSWWSKEGLKSLGKDVGVFAFVALFIILPFRIYVAEPYLVDGRSMDPTFSTGDYLIVDKLSEIKRNDVVVFKAVNANQPNKSFIKRIIGLPGETVIVKDNTVKIINSENPDGFTLDQSYITHKSTGSYQKTLAGDEYFVMGDNRAESYDSRYWGALNRVYITGKPIVRLFGIKTYGPMPVPLLNKFDILPGKETE